MAMPYNFKANGKTSLIEVVWMPAVTLCIDLQVYRFNGYDKHFSNYSELSWGLL
jgi:hypothetical protein